MHGMPAKFSEIRAPPVSIDKEVPAILRPTADHAPEKGRSPGAVMVSDPLESRTTPIPEEEAAILRSSVRKRVLWAAKLVRGSKCFNCVVVDLSLGGARIHLAQPLGKG